MYGLIRIFIGCIILCCINLKFKKLIKTRRHKIIIATSIIIFVTMLMMIPIENLFITFNSPKKAFEYYQGKKYKVNFIVNGKNSDFVIGEDHETWTYLIIPKDTKGWKIGTGINTKHILKQTHDAIRIDVYQYKNTNDYFVSILDMNGGYSQITDSFQSEFSALEQPMDVLEKTYVTYYTNIQDFTDEYWINVNGEKIIVNDQ